MCSEFVVCKVLDHLRGSSLGQSINQLLDWAGQSLRTLHLDMNHSIRPESVDQQKCESTTEHKAADDKNSQFRTIPKTETIQKA